MKKIVFFLFCILLFSAGYGNQYDRLSGSSEMHDNLSTAKSSPHVSTPKSRSSFSKSRSRTPKGTSTRRSAKRIRNSSSYSLRKSQSKSSSQSGIARDKNGKIKRSTTEKHAFMKQSGFPKGRPGYVVDHIVPLKKGGCDCPANMQWQTIQEAKAKDKWE